MYSFKGDLVHPPRKTSGRPSLPHPLSGRQNVKTNTHIIIVISYRTMLTMVSLTGFI